MPKIKNGRLQMTLLHNGAIGQISDDGIMVNQIKGNALDGSLSNIYLRIKTMNHWEYTPLTGPSADSQVTYSNNTVLWRGNFHQIAYQVKLLLGADQWFWQINLTSSTEVEADLTYAQDLGLGEEGFVTSNEAYASQYLDHFISQQDSHITIATRQNQAQKGGYPYLQEGSFSPLDSFSTDGIQFFGTSYRQNNVPVAMQREKLENKNYQYELGLTALRTKPFKVTGKTTEVVFYNAFQVSQPAANQTLLFDSPKLQQTYQDVLGQTTTPTTKLASTKLALPFAESIAGKAYTSAELQELFMDQKQVEKDQNGQILSFFTADNSHVVLPNKEVAQQRQTGNIILAGRTITPGTPLLASTQFMSGIFQSHIVFGNTNMNILATNVRDPYNLFKVTGTRIYLKVAGKYRVLGLPSAYVMTYNGADWYYKFADDTVIVSSDAASEHQQISLQLRSLQNRKYDVLVTTQLNDTTMGATPEISTKDFKTVITPAAGTLVAQRNKQLGYQIDYHNYHGQQLKLTDENSLFGNSDHEITDQLVASYQQTDSFEIITGLKNAELVHCDIKQERSAHSNYLEEILRHFKLNTNDIDQVDKVQQTNIIMRWFAHDALVHLLSPHGLEQYGGAAWGTRDLSQGPTEFFLSTGHYQQVRQIILKLYAHQFVENGNWPQWFMFDEYSDQFADESHGDVIVWPLKVVADYLAVTNDQSILTEQLPYMSLTTKKMTEEKATLSAHIKKQLDYIQDHFLFDTYVSAYGDGDWDDTLQPADPAQKQTMASTWTEELTIETMRKCQQVFTENHDLQELTAKLAKNMMADFTKYFEQDSVLPGFIRMNAQHEVTPLIHPKDGITGIDYRLLPLSQGVLSQILTGDKADQALSLIKTHLLFPDGVRLMDKPSTYHGGTSIIFKRAEQAANFGREIGLLYVHAHIRYAEAIATHGDQATSWELLQLVNPIRLQARVKNAALRQANTYFSSSDADFSDRYQAQTEFDRLKSQTIPVKGGWRLYSSGPGIYIGSILNDIFSISTRKTFNQSAFSEDISFAPEVKLSINH
ncbi:amylo-alpha-1,6-glucosidase [Lapidilactobacillus wuchangensis]|uniref:amylo-alpha-1,6-glucosidase n=1 Tax=Lapidilactobacillus wuchangensis TaxID=2486001 RepID=UPI0013DDEDE8|nr:amylo-alpha-1,6-glucosidase [Lapidilactobacillus wuchangensis]